MTDRCPHLDYRRSADDREFETERAYCTVVDRFVQPMRADVCNGRYDLSPARHCEFYREREGIEDPWLTGGDVGGETNEDGGVPDAAGNGSNGGGGDDVGVDGDKREDSTDGDPDVDPTDGDADMDPTDEDVHVDPVDGDADRDPVDDDVDEGQDR